MRKVLIIAGHNGKGTGAGGFIDEGLETIVLRNKVRDFLNVNYGIHAITDKDELSLSGVISWIKNLLHKSDIVIDIHFNAFNKTARGVEALVSSDGEIERPMATELCVSIAKILDTTNRGVKGEASGHHSKLAMLSKFEAEQLILEVCFCDNEKDSLAYQTKRNEVAKAIAAIVAKYAVL